MKLLFIYAIIIILDSKDGLACVRCGFEDMRALSIDHINGGGYEHRKILKRESGISFYRWLKHQDYPKGYQTLCMNCQFIKREEQKEATGRKEGRHGINRAES